jgi:hypothetical protein
VTESEFGLRLWEAYRFQQFSVASHRGSLLVSTMESAWGVTSAGNGGDVSRELTAVKWMSGRKCVCMGHTF